MDAIIFNNQLEFESVAENIQAALTQSINGYSAVSYASWDSAIENAETNEKALIIKPNMKAKILEALSQDEIDSIITLSSDDTAWFPINEIN